jgi:hypothetical protein
MEWRYSSTILDLGTKWRWVVSFTSPPLYPRGKRPWYPLDKRPGGQQSQSGRCGVGKNVLSLPEIEPRSSSPYPVAIPTELSWLKTTKYSYFLSPTFLKLGHFFAQKNSSLPLSEPNILTTQQNISHFFRSPWVLLVFFSFRTNGHKRCSWEKSHTSASSLSNIRQCYGVKKAESPEDRGNLSGYENADAFYKHKPKKGRTTESPKHI